MHSPKLKQLELPLTTLTTSVSFQLDCLVHVVLPTTESLPANSLQQIPSNKEWFALKSFVVRFLYSILD